jgi:hypothetical protein
LLKINVLISYFHVIFFILFLIFFIFVSLKKKLFTSISKFIAYNQLFAYEYTFASHHNIQGNTAQNKIDIYWNTSKAYPQIWVLSIFLIISGCSDSFFAVIFHQFSTLFFLMKRSVNLRWCSFWHFALLPWTLPMQAIRYVSYYILSDTLYTNQWSW